ncbi:MAG TPA: IclR family transcriptional regulator [Stellaceae bacterium]|nr:IclR family transcriptional regulator [Stellaceae bacterium]
MSRRATPSPAPGRPAYFTATLAKGLDILEALSSVEDTSLTDLSRRLGVSGPTLFRILATLTARGYAEKHGQTGRYRATLKSWALGAQVVRRLTLRDVARPHLEALLAETREAPHLAVLEGDGVVIIDRLEAPHPVRVDTYVGQRAPAHCSATGKAILAFRPAALLSGTAPLTRYTSATIDQPAALARELAFVRERGYAINQEEWRRGVCAIAVPLRGQGGAVVASLSLTMPTERFLGKGALRRFLKPLARAAAAISTQLGEPARIA